MALVMGNIKDHMGTPHSCSSPHKIFCGPELKSDPELPS